MGNNAVKLMPKCCKVRVHEKQIDSRHNQNDVHFTPTPDRIANVNIRYTESDLDDDSRFLCEICADAKSIDESFNVKGCAHFYCIECTARYIMSRLDDNIVYITCPISNCEGVLDPEYCRGILPQDVFDKWGAALCESAIDSTQKFYCPYTDCSTLLIKECEGSVEHECPHCKRAFCVKCKAPWHPNMNCETYQKSKEESDDRALVYLAERNRWRRCPKCQFYIEKSKYCNYMRCRCGCTFCYECGGTSVNRFTHGCRKC